MRGDWKDEAMQYRDVDRAAQKKAEEAMNQTPRTDAITLEDYLDVGCEADDLAVLARTLERELAAKDAELAKWKAGGSTGTIAQWRDKAAQCDAKDATIERLRRVVQRIVDMCPMCNCGDECQDDECALARAALVSGG